MVLSTTYVSTLKKNNAKLIRLRWVYVSLIMSVPVVSLLSLGVPTKTSISYSIICAFGFISNSILYIIMRKIKLVKKQLYGLFFTQLAIDFIIASWIMIQNSGLVHVPLLFALPILSSGLMLSSRIIYSTTLFASLLFLAIELSRLILNDTNVSSERTIVMVFYPLAFLIFGKLVNQLLLSSTSELKEESLDSFLSNLSLNLLHPASRTSNIISGLNRHSDKFDKETKEKLIMLTEDNRRVMQQLNNILEASSSQKIVHEDEIELQALLKKVGVLTANNFGRSEDYIADLGNRKINIFANKQKIVVVIVNILNNAFQNTKNGEKVKLTLRQSGNEALIVIEDEGSGIDNKRISHLLERYDVRKGKLNGAGLGLFVSKKIVQSHRGSFHIFSEKNGTRVMIKLKRGRYHDH